MLHAAVSLTHLLFVATAALLPPSCLGIMLEYELRDRSREMKEIDLLHLCPE